MPRRRRRSRMGPFRLDRAARRVYQGEKEIELTSTEFKLLEFFLTHPGTAWSREQLLREVWGEQHFVTPRTVDVHIRRIARADRRKARRARLSGDRAGFRLPVRSPLTKLSSPTVYGPLTPL